jgi:hypothetical protein
VVGICCQFHHRSATRLLLVKRRAVCVMMCDVSQPRRLGALQDCAIFITRHGKFVRNHISPRGIHHHGATGTSSPSIDLLLKQLYPIVNPPPHNPIVRFVLIDSTKRITTHHHPEPSPQRAQSNSPGWQPRVREQKTFAPTTFRLEAFTIMAQQARNRLRSIYYSNNLPHREPAPA